MTCETWIEALSATADGEDPGVDPRLLEAHLDRCPSCRAFATEIGAISVGRVVESPTMPDMSRRVARLAAIADRARVSVVLRVLLAGVAALIVVSSIPELLGDSEGGHVSHDARHVGAFSLAFAVGLLVVAVRPARARTLLPVTFVVAAALAVTAILDVAEGHVEFFTEGRHLPEVASLVLVWLLSRATVAADPSTAASAGRLRLVEPEGSGSRREAG